MSIERLLILVSFFLGASLLVSCGGVNCSFSSLSVSPPSAATSVGSSQQFTAFGGGLSNGCAATASNLTNVSWTVSDTTNVSVTNTNGIATMKCLGATQGSVTVTATLPASANKGHSLNATGSLTCN